MPNERKLFWHNLDKIKNGLVLSDFEFASFMGLSLAHYTKCKNSLTFLPLDCTYALAEKLNFHFNDLITNDFKLVAQSSLSGEYTPLPTKYTAAAYSKMTPTKNIINYLELTRGTRAKTNLIRKFQLSEAYVSEDSNKTNIHLISDVVKYLAQTYQFTEQEFIAMGQRTPHTFSGDLLKNKLTNHKNILSVLDVFFDECTHIFDKNCQYRISDIVNDFAVIEVLPDKNVLEELKIKSNDFGNEQVCLTKMGCISSLTWFKYKRNAHIEKISSVYQGDATNKYLMDLSPFKKLSRLSDGDVLEFKPIHH